MESSAGEMRAWVEGERREKAQKETRKRLRGAKWTTVTVKVPICPKCKSPMEHELDPGMRALWSWVCPTCRHTI